MDKLLAIIAGAILGLVIGLAFALLTGFVVWLCWNGVVPQLFHLSQIGYWQAVVLSILCNALFKAGVSTSKN